MSSEQSYLSPIGETVNARGRKALVCRCICGKEVVLEPATAKVNRSCGCLRYKFLGDKKRRHGLTGSPTYRTWVNMLTRCTNPNSDKYKWYGAKGIKVCLAWKSFESFLADMGERPQGMSLDRVDPAGNYQKSNCRWATPTEQCNNRKNTKRFSFFGEMLTMSEAARKHGVVTGSLWSAMKDGCDPQFALERLVKAKQEKGIEL